MTPQKEISCHIFNVAFFQKFLADLMSHIIREYTGKKIKWFLNVSPLTIMNILLWPFMLLSLYFKNPKYMLVIFLVLTLLTIYKNSNSDICSNCFTCLNYPSLCWVVRYIFSDVWPMVFTTFCKMSPANIHNVLYIS